jgi:hypothetical protein
MKASCSVSSTAKTPGLSRAGAVTLPFAFFGVKLPFRGTASAGEVARVGGDRITQAEFANAILTSKTDAAVARSEL